MKILCENIRFSYENVQLFHNLNLSVQQGEHVWIRGRSGAGKSSLLKIIAGLEKPESGRVWLGSNSLHNKSDSELRQIRLENLAYVHQDNHLIEHWTTEQNLHLVNSQTAEIQNLLQSFQLPEKIFKQKISKLSGGEKQRISLMRMLLQKPKLALLDEPTAHLDDFNTENLLSVIQNELKATTLVVVSHDARIEKLKLRQIQIDEISK